MSDPLFHPSTTHIEVTCWQCGHQTTFTPDQLPKAITQAEFEAKAICQCGTGWPSVVRLPKPPSRWGT